MRTHIFCKFFALTGSLGLAAVGCPTSSRDGHPTMGASTHASSPVAQNPVDPTPTARPSPRSPLPKNASVIFLHHSTGENIWRAGVPEWIVTYNGKHGTQYALTERAYPHDPYPWDNYPYDYWNLWVEHPGPTPYEGQENLENLTKQFQVIVFKHCFPVSGIEPSSGPADVRSNTKTLDNYKAQYAAIKQKLHTYPQNRFIVWTGAALTRTAMANDYGGNAETAKRTQQFFKWVKETWNEPNDNIFVFDFYALETEGGLYLLDPYANSPGDPHPNESFSQKVAPRFAQRVVDVIEGRGDTGSLTGN